jgi:GxxExxY protein
MLRVASPLPEAVEQLIYATIGCCIAVHRELGPGLLEKIYAGALSLELTASGIVFEREKRYEVRYRGKLLSHLALDFVVGDVIVVEVKSIEQFAPIHHKQILNYMRLAGLRAGLLINFNVAILPDGISRKVL